MSNPLSVRRVTVQTIDENGNPEGPPTFGVVAADGNSQSYNDIYQSLQELNAAIDEEGCILHVIGDYEVLWPDADPAKIGTDNFYGKNWTDGDDDDIDITLEDE